MHSAYNVKLNTHLHAVLRLGVAELYSLLPIYACMAWSWEDCTLYYSKSKEVQAYGRYLHKFDSR